MTYIIAVTGPIGGGKSSLTHEIARALGNSSVVQFDDYEGLTSRPPEEILAWLEGGADVEAFSFPLLKQHLERLKNGQSIIEPRHGTTIEARDYVVFETPFGRSHPDMAPFIDLQLWIEIPLDLALSRKVKQIVEYFIEVGRDDVHSQQLAWLRGFLEGYESMVSKMLRLQKKMLKPDSDVLINGLRNLDSTVPAAVEAIRKRFRA